MNAGAPCPNPNTVGIMTHRCAGSARSACWRSTAVRVAHVSAMIQMNRTLKGTRGLSIFVVAPFIAQTMGHKGSFWHLPSTLLKP